MIRDTKGDRIACRNASLPAVLSQPLACAYGAVGESRPLFTLLLCAAKPKVYLSIVRQGHEPHLSLAYPVRMMLAIV